MKFLCSRRLKTWNDDIFTGFCPFRYGVEVDEEHAFLNCKITIIEKKFRCKACAILKIIKKLYIINRKIVINYFEFLLFKKMKTLKKFFDL